MFTKSACVITLSFVKIITILNNFFLFFNILKCSLFLWLQSIHYLCPQWQMILHKSFEYANLVLEKHWLFLLILAALLTFVEIVQIFISTGSICLKYVMSLLSHLINLIIIINYIYIALFCFSKHSKRFTLSGGISLSTTSVQHPSGWCDGSHSAPERPPHTSLLVERRRSDEANRQIWVLLGGHDDQRTMSKLGQDAEVTPLHTSNLIHLIYFRLSIFSSQTFGR